MFIAGRHLENIDINRDGGVLVVSSNLTGQIWDGGLNYFSDSTNIECTLYQTHLSKHMPASTADGCWCAPDSVVVGTDNGHLQVFTLDNGFFVDSCHLLSHHSYVTSLSVTCSSAHCVSGGGDGCVNIADLNEMRLISKYHTHSEIVNRVNTHNSSPDLFASCSMDGSVLIYDMRKSQPARRISITDAVVTAVNYHGDKLAVGTEAGQLLVKDMRGGTTPLKEANDHCRSIRRIVFCPSRSSWIATGGEDGVVSVLQYDLLNTQSIYMSENHSDFVTGLVWNSEELISCSWDSTVQKHCITNEVLAGEPHAVNGHCSLPPSCCD
ncbi:methylosome protein WDR77-like [Watersipora subatra]|uniref:methylosome protein WDR77-like n=1 Tax=Watersipora subatra TaxID=2589382 RepID=UPI00355AE5D9